MHAGLKLGFLSLAGFLLMLATSLAASPQTRVFTKYSIAIAGIPVGNADVSTLFQDNRFDITADGRTSGVSRLVSDGRGTLSVTGQLQDGKIVPTAFKMDTIDDKFITKVRMSMVEGSIKDLIAVPPLARKPDRIPVEEEHYRNILDPLSAFLVVLDRDGRIAPEDACNRTIPVFDGWQRFDILLSFKEQRDARLGGRNGYSGPVVVCQARYVPIAGHRPSRKATVYLQNNKNMELWLAPVAGVPVLVPVHVKIGTRLGPLTLSASVFNTQTGGTASAKAQ